jgi:3-phenylpropionate/trans-cinnamate dioxygenase subunit alpha
MSFRANQCETLEQMVDWERGLIAGRIFTDDEIYRQESEKVFPRTWIYLAHEDQLKTYGDFLSSYIGNDRILVVRQRDGSIKALLNACRHRGMAVCRADLGNAKSFLCSFHGWTYDAAGNLTTAPNFEGGYRGQLDKSQWGLVAVPRVESYKGLIFGCFDPDAPSLIDYLGEMAWYLDCLLDRREGGTEIVGGVHKMRTRGNWKLAAEQFAGDNYHAIMTHVSVRDALANPQAGGGSGGFTKVMSLPGRQFSSRQGHGMAGYLLRNSSLPSFTSDSSISEDEGIVASYYKSTRDEVANRLGAQRADCSPDGAGLVFPNFAFLSGVMGSSTIAVFQPRGPHLFDHWRWGIVDKAAPKAVKEAMVRCLHVWPIAIADADDGENWGGIQSSLGGPIAQSLKLNYQMGIGSEGPDPVYPGTLAPNIISEFAQRRFYRRWLEFMTSQGWPAVVE